MAGGPAKVVYINTQYVETDALSFKSVVQTLTGKNSVVPGGDAPPPPVARRRRSSASKAAVPDFSNYNSSPEDSVQPEMRGGSSNKLMEFRNSFLLRNLSLKEFDKLLKDLPPLDDLHSLFCD